MARRKLGELLRERGHISAADLTKAIEAQKTKLVRLGEVLFERSLVDKVSLITALAEVSGIPYVDCQKVEPYPQALKLIPAKLAEKYCALPLRVDGRCLVIVMAEPQNLDSLSQIRFSAGCELSPRFGFRKEILRAVRQHYRLGSDIDSLDDFTDDENAEAARQMEFISTSKRDSNIEALRELQAELLHRRTPAIEITSSVLHEAIRTGASDIHIEALGDETLVRMRHDGVLQESRRLNRGIHNALISRIKILGDLDIAERRNPQDGRFMVRIGERRVDFRVSSLPTQCGEKIVLRLLDANANLKSFSELGLPQSIQGALGELLRLPQGMLLVTGPTGSGKSTTLYAGLSALLDPAVNIVTIEDPVEYELQGINQVNINTKTGMTFASALRSVLRQDPNVIMVGEIRDRETAEIAMKATQTGHLVLSTLHTNGSLESVVRLLDLGVAGYLIASSVSGILAQRLVRKLCGCHVEQPITDEESLRMVKVGLTDPPATMKIAVGCSECNRTGYKGRIGVYELLQLDDTLRSAIRTTVRLEELRGLARSSGMKTLADSALDLVRDGVTTLDEILRAVPMQTSLGLMCENCSQALGPKFHYCPYCGTRQSASAGATFAQTNAVEIEPGALLAGSLGQTAERRRAVKRPS
jgi:type IV pilus assembly protein PilB